MTEFDPTTNPVHAAAVKSVLAKMREEMFEGEANEKHSIIVCDPSTGKRHIIGPFPDRATAIAEVPQLMGRYLKSDPEFANLQYEVVITFAPEES